MHMFYFVSSPYLFVFDDDHVRGTWEQMMLQVDLVRHRARAGASLGEFIHSFNYVFESVVNLQFIRLGYFH